MMSDVLAFVKDQAVLLTGLCNPQVIRTAEMMDVICIVFVRGKTPDEDMIELAKERGQSLAQMALAWVLRDGVVTSVLIGASKPQQILDNIEAVLRTIEILTAPWGFAWSPKRITLSSVGVTKLKEPIVLKDYLDKRNNSEYKCVNPLESFLELTKCHLAISLHNPISNERLGLMPMQKAFPIEETLRIIRKYDFTGQRRVSFEYTMFGGVNDSKKHADAIVRLLKGLECRINLIRFHSIPDSPLVTSPMPVIEAFKDRLNNAGITTTIRASRGEDIFAACGMLAGKK